MNIRYGWQPDLSSLRGAQASLIWEKLCQYIGNPSTQRIRAWTGVSDKHQQDPNIPSRPKHKA